MVTVLNIFTLFNIQLDVKYQRLPINQIKFNPLYDGCPILYLHRRIYLYKIYKK
jgi:hypothetical protein